MVSYSVDLQLPEHVWGRCLLRPVYKGCALIPSRKYRFTVDHPGGHCMKRPPSR